MAACTPHPFFGFLRGCTLSMVLGDGRAGRTLPHHNIPRRGESPSVVVRGELCVVCGERCGIAWGELYVGGLENVHYANESMFG